MLQHKPQMQLASNDLCIMSLANIMPWLIHQRVYCIQYAWLLCGKNISNMQACCPGQCCKQAFWAHKQDTHAKMMCLRGQNDNAAGNITANIAFVHQAQNECQIHDGLQHSFWPTQHKTSADCSQSGSGNLCCMCSSKNSRIVSSRSLASSASAGKCWVTSLWDTPVHDSCETWDAASLYAHLHYIWHRAGHQLTNNNTSDQCQSTADQRNGDVDCNIDFSAAATTEAA